MKKKICARIRLISENLPPMLDGNGVKVNHYRRMKDAYERSGNNINAILDYANMVAKALAKSLNENMLMEQAKPLAQKK
jgi:phosphopantothenoylcysteine synthetase/decarboxylase